MAKKTKAVWKERSIGRGGKSKVWVEMTTQFEDAMQEFGVNLTITSSSSSQSSFNSINYLPANISMLLYRRCGGAF